MFASWDASADLGFTRLDKTAFEEAPRISLDYSVIEKTRTPAMLAFGCRLERRRLVVIAVGDCIARRQGQLENPGKVPLEIIELQIGTYLGEDDIYLGEDDIYLGEDDIIRLDDLYHRAPEETK